MFRKITDRIYYRPHDGYTDRPNIGLILGDKHTLLFDAGNSAANVASLRAELAVQGLPEPDFVAVSHWHWDHTFGMYAWGVPTIAGCLTNERLKIVQAWAWDDGSMKAREISGEDVEFCNKMIRREYPDRSQIRVTTADIVFEGRMTIDLGGITCELIHAAGPHSEDSVICHVPSERFVFLGDSNGKNLYKYPWRCDEKPFAEAVALIPYDWDRVDAYLELLGELDFTRCIGGHADDMSREALFSSYNR